MFHNYKHVTKIDEQEMDAIIVKIKFFKNGKKLSYSIIIKLKILKIGKKKPFSLMSQGLLNQKIRFLALKIWPLAREQDIFII